MRYWVGTPIMQVTPRSPMSLSVRDGSKDGSSTTVAPTRHASSGWTFHAAMWNCGSAASTTSSVVSGIACWSARLFQKQLSCVSTTPFGAAAEPEVKITMSGSSSRTSRASHADVAGGTCASMPALPSETAAADRPALSRASWASVACCSSTSTSAGSTRDSSAASSVGVRRHDSGTNATPARAHAKNAATWSVELAATTAMRCPGP